MCPLWLRAAARATEASHACRGVLNDALLACRMSVASVNRELRRWSNKHGDDVWDDVDLPLAASCLADSACWAGVQWLQSHSAHVRELGLMIRQASIRLHLYLASQTAVLH